MSPGEAYSAHLSESIPMSQYPGDYCSASNSLMRRSSGYNPSLGEEPESEDRTPSPLIGLPPHPHQQYTLQHSTTSPKSDYNSRSYGTPHNPYKHQQPSQQQHRVQVQIPMSNCILTHSTHGSQDETSFTNGEGLGASGSIRLYMNQSAGKEETDGYKDTLWKKAQMVFCHLLFTRARFLVLFPT